MNMEIIKILYSDKIFMLQCLLALIGGYIMEYYIIKYKLSFLVAVILSILYLVIISSMTFSTFK